MASTAERIAKLESLLDAYWEAEEAVLRNQSYKMPDGREMTRADLKEIRAGRRETLTELDRLKGCHRAVGRMRRGIPLVR